MKTCFKCGLAKPLDDFYQHPNMADGHLNKCKACARADVRGNYAAKRLDRMAYERVRSQRPDRRAARYTKESSHRKAHVVVGNAIRDGRLVRQPCEVCGATERIEAHHDDYSKPLEVRWFCFKHHREVGHGQVTEETARENAA